MMNRGTKARAALVFGTAASICIAIGASARAEDATSHRDEMPAHGGRKPPPEAFSACEGKSEGAECSVSFRDQTRDGVCVAPADEPLFCMPNDMPPPPSGGRHPDGPPPSRIIM
jgi:hypothetical protein